MLKIKDNIDLKELEKFGYGLVQIRKWNEKEYKPAYYEKNKCTFREYTRPTYQYIRVSVEDRIVRFYNKKGETYDKNWAKDLIQAGFIEKL